MIQSIKHLEWTYLMSLLRCKFLLPTNHRRSYLFLVIASHWQVFLVGIQRIFYQIGQWQVTVWLLNISKIVLPNKFSLQIERAQTVLQPSILLDLAYADISPILQSNAKLRANRDMFVLIPARKCLTNFSDHQTLAEQCQRKKQIFTYGILKSTHQCYIEDGKNIIILCFIFIDSKKC